MTKVLRQIGKINRYHLGLQFFFACLNLKFQNELSLPVSAVGSGCKAGLDLYICLLAHWLQHSHLRKHFKACSESLSTLDMFS